MNNRENSKETMKKTFPLKLKPKDAQKALSMIGIEFGWYDLLVDRWAVNIVTNRSIFIPQGEYEDMRRDANKEQHDFMDELWGKDVERIQRALQEDVKFTSKELKVGEIMVVTEGRLRGEHIIRTHKGEYVDLKTGYCYDQETEFIGEEVMVKLIHREVIKDE